MRALEAVDEQELRGRMDEVLRRLDAVLREIGPKMREVGNLREEAELICRELERRGLAGVQQPALQG